MSKSIKQQGEVARFRQDIQSQLRARVREAIEVVLEEELAEALGCGSYERCGERLGYRNGKERRRITTAYGLKELEIPRGRLVTEKGRSREFHSQILVRYQRRTGEVDEAILGAYLAGANSPADQASTGSLAGRGTPVEKLSLSGGVSPERAFCPLERARSVNRALRDPVSGWFSHGESVYFPCFIVVAQQT